MKNKFTDLIKSEIPVLVDFYTDWCEPCKMMNPVLKEIARKMGNKVKVIKIDVDKNRNVAEFYNIQSIPTMIIFKENEIKWRDVGVKSFNEIEKAINKINKQNLN